MEEVEERSKRSKHAEQTQIEARRYDVTLSYCLAQNLVRYQKNRYPPAVVDISTVPQFLRVLPRFGDLHAISGALEPRNGDAAAVL